MIVLAVLHQEERAPERVIVARAYIALELIRRELILGRYNWGSMRTLGRDSLRRTVVKDTFLMCTAIETRLPDEVDVRLKTIVCVPDSIILSACMRPFPEFPKVT